MNNQCLVEIHLFYLNIIPGILWLFHDSWIICKPCLATLHNIQNTLSLTCSFAMLIWSLCMYHVIQDIFPRIIYSASNVHPNPFNYVVLNKGTQYLKYRKDLDKGSKCTILKMQLLLNKKWFLSSGYGFTMLIHSPVAYFPVFRVTWHKGHSYTSNNARNVKYLRKLSIFQFVTSP